MSHSLDKIVAFYQHTNNHHPKFWWWFVVVCLHRLWFHYISSKIWWFAVLYRGFGGLRWFAVICGGLSFSHTVNKSLNRGINPFRCSVRKYTYEIPNPLRLLYVNIRTQTGIEKWALLTDALRYLDLCIVSCARAHHMLPVWVRPFVD